jgi:hypothetical protein
MNATAAILPVMQSLAGIKLLDHGAPPQHELNGRSTVLLLNFFLQKLSRVAALENVKNWHSNRAGVQHVTLRSWCSCQVAIPLSVKRCFAASF